MRVRRLVAAAVAVPLLAALPADAAPKRKPPCVVALTDPRGDAGPLGSGNLDVIRGSITQGGNELYAVLYLAGQDAWTGEGVAGAGWRLGASRNGVQVEFGAESAGAAVPRYTYVKVNGQYVPHAGGMFGDFIIWKIPRTGALASAKSSWSGASAATLAGPLDADTAAGKPPRC